MRNWLLQEQLASNVDVEEEFRQSCFHITVYKSYGGSPMPGRGHALTPAQVAATGVGKSAQQSVSE